MGWRRGQEGVKQGTAVAGFRLRSGKRGVREDLRSERSGDLAEPQTLDSTAAWGARARGTEQGGRGSRVRPGLLLSRSHRAEPVCRVKFAVCPSVFPGKWGDSALKFPVSLWELSVGREPLSWVQHHLLPTWSKGPVLQYKPPSPPTPAQAPFLIFTGAYLILT